MGPVKAVGLTAAILSVAILLLMVLPARAAGDPPAGVHIATFSAEPARTGARTDTEKVGVGLNLSVHNDGAGPANASVVISEGAKTLLNRTVTIEGNSSYNFSRLWTLQGIGNHTAVATISGDGLTGPATMNATCYVKLLPLVEHPSPWYTIPCALSFIIIPVVAFWLLVRYLKRGGREEGEG